ncbi:GIY-YIG nuclease family protein [Bacillus toyonensis]|uniref:GIY-YIG nuclease family protein n=1 Tax=Bacillus toyonensis TaxID=155322 RepID=UPI001C019184|nr:GIY-YIG nuclease family protein [Bacillus toyonensis]QWG98388.1 GIY-YIG nuclease family protein [Bacillus toyonensis]
MPTPKQKLTPNFNIELNNVFFPNEEKSDFKITINSIIGPPEFFSFLDSDSHPSKKGVYVIFLPNVRDYNRIGEGCIYVGQGNLKNRLYVHKHYERFGDKKAPFNVIFYEIEDDVDRKAVERILIKYHEPSFNKEGESNIERVKKDSEYSIRVKSIIGELEDIYKDEQYNDKKYSDVIDFTTVVVDLLQDGFDLDDIQFEISRYTSGVHGLEGIPYLNRFLFNRY